MRELCLIFCEILLKLVTCYVYSIDLSLKNHFLKRLAEREPK